MARRVSRRKKLGRPFTKGEVLSRARVLRTAVANPISNLNLTADKKTREKLKKEAAGNKKLKVRIIAQRKKGLKPKKRRR